MSSPNRARASNRAATVVLLLATAACHASPRPAIAPSPTTRRSILELQHDIDALLAVPALERTYWGILVRSLAADDTLYAVNPRKLMMPASNMKIATLAATAERLGWDYTYETQLQGVGAIDSGSLDGDLLVVGSGDPSIGSPDGLSSQVFDRWTKQLKAMGILAIEGRIIGDDNAFDDETLGAGWAWDNLADGYATGVGALQFNENTVLVTVEPGQVVGGYASVTLEPEGSGLAVRNGLKTAAADTAASIDTRRVPGSQQLDLRGSVPLGSAPSIHTMSVDNPTLFFVNALRAALIAHGIDVKGAALDIDDLTDALPLGHATLFASYRSPPLSALAKRMMKVSQNLYAETLLKTIGAAAGPRTAATGRATVGEVLQSWGIATSGLIQVDGSGLSRYNLVTPETLVTILTYINRDDRLREPFETALPIAGRDGTLARRMNSTAAAGNARAKTGSISNVRALSGYVKTADGEPLVFSILANNFETSPDTIEQVTDAIVVRLAQFSRR